MIQVGLDEEDGQSMQYTLRANMNKSLMNEPGRAPQQIDMMSQ